MVADKAVIEERLALIREHIAYIEKVKPVQKEQLEKNRERYLALLHALQLTIEACIDIGSHIISADELGVPQDYADVFNIMAQKGILPKGFSEDLRNMARFRNRLVHFYLKIDLEQVCEIVNNRIKDFQRYVEFIDAYLAK